MTREEAIYELERMKTWSKDLSDNEIEAIVIALKALSSSQEPCTDAISREAVLKAIDAKAWEFCDYLISKGKNDEQKPVSHFADNLRECISEDLPSVTPAEKVGQWIPVSERSPNFAGAYLVTRYFPNNVMNPTYLVDACFFDGTDTWHNDNRINHERKYLTNVVAWLEEPEPYKASPTGTESEGKE